MSERAQINAIEFTRSGKNGGWRIALPMATVHTLPSGRELGEPAATIVHDAADLLHDKEFEDFMQLIDRITKRIAAGTIAPLPPKKEATPGKTMSKTVAITLTIGAAHLLGQLAGVPGLLTDAATLYRVGQFAEDYLSDLPISPKDATQVEVDAWANDVLAPINISTGVHDALKTAVKTAIEKGMLPAGKPTLCLIRELDLAPKED